MLIQRCLLVLVTLILLIMLAPACGGGDNDDEATSPTSKATATATTQPTTAQPTTAAPSGKPVKIGVLSTWTGPAAMSGMFFTDTIIKTMEKQVEDMGGILGGRPVEWVRYDTGGEVAKAVAGVKKLVAKDNVSVMCFGGSSPAEYLAVSDAAEEERVLFVSVSPVEDVAEKKYTIEGSISYEGTRNDAATLLTGLLTPKPETFGYISYDDPQSRYSIEKTKEKVESIGMETVYEEFIGAGITDFSPYLTKLKYKDPDCLYLNVGSEQFRAIAKQIMDLGGWGGMRVVAVGTASSAMRMPGAEGWIVITPWHPSKNDPESVKFKQDYEAATGKPPTDLHIYPYNTFLTAINVIDQAGTDDPAGIARYARSGNLEFDTPMGRQHIGTDGMSILRQMYVQFQKGGVAVPFP